MTRSQVLPNDLRYVVMRYYRQDQRKCCCIIFPPTTLCYNMMSPPSMTHKEVTVSPRPSWCIIMPSYTSRVLSLTRTPISLAERPSVWLYVMSVIERIAISVSPVSSACIPVTGSPSPPTPDSLLLPVLLTRPITQAFAFQVDWLPVTTQYPELCRAFEIRHGSNIAKCIGVRYSVRCSGDGDDDVPHGDDDGGGDEGRGDSIRLSRARLTRPDTG
ncbi:hypothetical protein RRG08_001634 [Elysia crispata]|uniref:Uncharacterized protein n=1 Tax=Elysia crispata TaxID=231223 RepID=A0AAE1AJT6_9GAST|nr:hypothetical protein RRG08_001634 [Elysia crispata]